MATANEELLDALTRHQIYLSRVSGSVRDRIHRVLDDTEADLVGQIETRMARAAGGLGSARELARLKAILRVVRRLRGRAWEQATKIWVEELSALALAESRIVAGLIDTASPVVLNLALPPPRLLSAIATSRPFEGRTLRQWARSVELEDLRRINNAVRVGMAAGETGPSIARRVVGTARLRGRDGLTQITRRNAEAITRTAVNHVGNSARAELFSENSDLFEQERFVATLDGRTTLVCAGNDGKVFSIGSGPIPPLHFACRSLRVPELGQGPISQRPARPATRRQLLREFGEEKGLGRIGSRERLPRGTKGAFDRFERRRLRELTGRLPGKTTYAEFLRRQSREFQDDVLGPTRARLFRDGRLQLDRFTNRNGDQIPLADLARKHAESFRAAGMEPSSFL